MYSAGIQLDRLDFWKQRREHEKGTGEEFKVKATWKVSKVESAFKDSFGIKINVALPGDSDLADDNLTLGEVSRSK